MLILFLVTRSRIKSYLPFSDEPTAANIDWGYSVKEEDETLQETILRFDIAMAHT
jgi:hypothetical protein